jgi:hypothetical protein
MLSQGPKFPASASNVDRDGKSSWGSVGAITAEGGAVAVWGGGAQNDYSDWLQASNFGFSIPPNSIIRGIKVEWKEFMRASAVRDHSIRLVKNSIIETFSIINGGNWPTISTWRAYGGASEKWGSTWTAAQINSPNFGTVISVGCDLDIGVGEVDACRVTVYYDLISDPGLGF